MSRFKPMGKPKTKPRPTPNSAALAMLRQRRDEAQRYVDEIEDFGSDLTGWEDGFVQDMEEHLKDPNWIPSNLQLDKLREIAEDKA